MTLEPASPQEEIHKPSRKGLYLPFIGLGLLIAIWSGVWFVAAEAAKKVAGGFILREAERGRDWVCPNQSVGGYPFRIEITCDRPQLLVKGAEGLKHEASLGGLSLLMGRILSRPAITSRCSQPPFRVKQGTAGEGELNWTSARASFRGGKEAFVDASVEIVAPVAALLGRGEAKDIRALAKDVSFSSSPLAGRCAGYGYRAQGGGPDLRAARPVDRQPGPAEA